MLLFAGARKHNDHEHDRLVDLILDGACKSVVWTKSLLCEDFPVLWTTMKDLSLLSNPQ